MNQSGDSPPVFDLAKYVPYLINSIFLSTRRRKKITITILLLQFVVPFIINLYVNYRQAGHFDNIQLVDDLENDGVLLKLLFGLIKYILVLGLLFKTPANTYEYFQPKKVGCLRFILLTGIFYFVAFADIVFGLLQQNNRDVVVHEKSFDTNKRIISGLVVYSSWYRDSIVNRKNYSVLDSLPANASGYMIIVHIDNNHYHFPHLEDVCKNLQTVMAQADFVNKPVVKTNYETCCEFTVSRFQHQPSSQADIPAQIPKPGQFVKIYYDPFKKYIRLSTNPTTLETTGWNAQPADFD